MSQSDYLILTFDGGGIRGLISALLVQQLDQELDCVSWALPRRKLLPRICRH